MILRSGRARKYFSGELFSLPLQPLPRNEADESSTRHIYFVGPGLVSSVAYIDPGNWATDLEAGANYGYKLLFVVLVASLAAVGTCHIGLPISISII